MSFKSAGYNTDTIAAIATPSGFGAISVIRLSGSNSLKILWNHFIPASKISIDDIESHRLYFGSFNEEDKVIDDVLVSYFKSPKSYTSEDAIEISCHGSEYIQQKILNAVLDSGARIAEPGEFTLRAFMNGKMDLSQAEAVADLIASQSENAHRVAMNQMRGGISTKINELRSKLIDFASLIELELDFSEEDVEFADRKQFLTLIDDLNEELTSLIDSFKIGNVMKDGIPVAIIGKPNVGKSTLLNAILNEEKAIVSHIPGTTRDTIEDTYVLDGFKFRFIDTAGLRKSQDLVENIGIERAYDKIKQASIIIYVGDVTALSKDSIHKVTKEFSEYINDESKHFIFVANKIDEINEPNFKLSNVSDINLVLVSAKQNQNIDLLKESLVKVVKRYNINNDVIITNSRHYNSLVNAKKSIDNVRLGFDNNVPTDLIAIDIRHALHELGTITGEITTDDLLGNIFGKFCIGK